jgi:hypothetical protein
MNIEVGSTYRANDGAFWTIHDARYYDVAQDFRFEATNTVLVEGNSVRYFDKDGRTGTDLRLICKYEPTVESWEGLDAALVWEWRAPDKVGLWAFGGNFKCVCPVLCSVNIIPQISSMMDSWRCYLGPIPEIAQPKKPVKQTLWMVKCFNRLLWEELWLPDEEVPKLWCLHDIAHKTCTTRTV